MFILNLSLDPDKRRELPPSIRVEMSGSASSAVDTAEKKESEKKSDKYYSSDPRCLSCVKGSDPSGWKFYFNKEQQPILIRNFGEFGLKFEDYFKPDNKGPGNYFINKENQEALVKKLIDFAKRKELIDEKLAESLQEKLLADKETQEGTVLFNILVFSASDPKGTLRSLFEKMDLFTCASVKEAAASAIPGVADMLKKRIEALAKYNPQEAESEAREFQRIADKGDDDTDDTNDVNLYASCEGTNFLGPDLVSNGTSFYIGVDQEGKNLTVQPLNEDKVAAETPEVLDDAFNKVYAFLDEDPTQVACSSSENDMNEAETDENEAEGITRDTAKITLHDVDYAIDHENEQKYKKEIFTASKKAQLAELLRKITSTFNPIVKATLQKEADGLRQQLQAVTGSKLDITV